MSEHKKWAVKKLKDMAADVMNDIANDENSVDKIVFEMCREILSTSVYKPIYDDAFASIKSGLEGWEKSPLSLSETAKEFRATAIKTILDAEEADAEDDAKKNTIWHIVKDMRWYREHVLPNAEKDDVEKKFANYVKKLEDVLLNCYSNMADVNKAIEQYRNETGNIVYRTDNFDKFLAWLMTMKKAENNKVKDCDKTANDKILNAPKESEPVCIRGISKCNAGRCEFNDKGICRGVVFPTYPPQYDPCVFIKN